MVRDRGTIKWSTMMLPEHAKILEDIWHATEYKNKPIIDEQKKEEINNLLYKAFENSLKIEVTYYKNYDYRKLAGYIKSVNILNQVIKINGTQINIADLIDAELRTEL